ncbi:MAG: acetyl-CoA hydrolase/transferase C-terminal domain-containing protein [Haloferacaceae archaeon]
MGEGAPEPVSAERAAELVDSGDVVGVSGFSNSGYPKAVPPALAEREGLSDLTILSGGTVGDELDDVLVGSGAVSRRIPYQSGEETRRRANDGRLAYADRHISQMGYDTRYGFFGDVDVAIVEALAVEDGEVVPTTSLGNTPVYVAEADTVIVEVNDHQHPDLRRLHDVYVPDDPPDREPIPITSPGDRIGRSTIPVDHVDAVVETDAADKTYQYGRGGETQAAIVENLTDLLVADMAAGRIPDDELRLQFGVGGLNNRLLESIPSIAEHADTVSFYGEALQDGILDNLAEGHMDVASGCALALTREGQRRLFDDIDTFADRMVLRPQEVSNSPEVVRRLGVVTINVALEVDIYGNANSTHLFGRDILNGLGGSGDFVRNGLVSIVALPSTAKGGDVSRVVPMVPHVDHNEHDIDVVVTERGVADLRGLSPRERAVELIENCAHPSYEDELMDYYERARRDGGQTPHHLDEALDWHLRWQG